MRTPVYLQEDSKLIEQERRCSSYLDAPRKLHGWFKHDDKLGLKLSKNPVIRIIRVGSNNNRLFWCK